MIKIGSNVFRTLDDVIAQAIGQYQSGLSRLEHGEGVPRLEFLFFVEKQNSVYSSLRLIDSESHYCEKYLSVRARECVTYCIPRSVDIDYYRSRDMIGHFHPRKMDFIFRKSNDKLSLGDVGVTKLGSYHLLAYGGRGGPRYKLFRKVSARQVERKPYQIVQRPVRERIKVSVDFQRDGLVTSLYVRFMSCPLI
jgi:hypothetical protein